MEMCLDEKWKLSSSSKKGSRRLAAVAPAVTSEASPRGLNKGRTSSRGAATGRSVVPGRLASLVKEQRARFYIVRRCVTMLVCWRD